jgi:hypothetical protein
MLLRSHSVGSAPDGVKIEVRSFKDKSLVDVKII